MTEYQAHLQQGLSQLRMYEFLAGQPSEVAPEAHTLHFLQMATENIAKAVFLRSGNPGWDKFRHAAFSAIPHHLRVCHVATKLGWKDFNAYQRFMRDIMPLCREIEQLHPQVGGSGAQPTAVENPNVEYPWPGRHKHGHEIWYVPASFQFGLLARMRRSLGLQLIGFLHVLIDRFETVF
jgi:hypothetical protein